MRSAVLVILFIAVCISCQDMRVRPRNSIPRPVTRPPIFHHITRVTIPNWGGGVLTPDWRKGLTERRIAFGRNGVQRDDRRGGIVTAGQSYLFTVTPHRPFDRTLFTRSTPNHTIWTGTPAAFSIPTTRPRIFG